MDKIKKIVIIGGKESGVGAALCAKLYGYDVFVSDSNAIVEPYRSELVQHQIPFEENKHMTEMSKSFDQMILSPGVPFNSAIVNEFISSGKEVLTEIEFAYQFIESSVFIGITGSNGKTTTTSLIYHVLLNANKNVKIVGNIGISFARSVSQGLSDIYVCELSSFQLEKIKLLAPHIAIITNITPDHLDRYDNDIEQYAMAKFNITSKQLKTDFIILNANDEISQQILRNVKPLSKVIQVAISNKDSYTSTNDHVYSFSDVSLKGKHNFLNISMSIEVLEKLGIEQSQILSGLNSFKGLEHRMEVVGEWQGISYMNDSKATNVDSVYFALDAINAPIIWIAGGIDKGNNYQVLNALVKEKVKAIICLGKNNKNIVDHFSTFSIPIFETMNFENTFYEIKKLAQKGDTVLLSPACASFDLFKNYEDRGNQFKAAIKNVI